MRLPFFHPLSHLYLTNANISHERGEGLAVPAHLSYQVLKALSHTRLPCHRPQGVHFIQGTLKAVSILSRLFSFSVLTLSFTATPSPILLNEFTNVFDSDFALARRHSYAVPEPHPSPPLASIARRRYSHCSPSRSPGHLSSPHHSLKSREPSPTSSDSDPKRRFPCQVPGCSRRFTSQYTLKVHTEAHKPKPRASFPCTLGCPESFSRQHDRLRHEVAKHGKVCEFLCAECGRFFSSSKTLGNHKCPVAQGQTRWVHH